MKEGRKEGGKIEESEGEKIDTRGSEGRQRAGWEETFVKLYGR